MKLLDRLTTRRAEAARLDAAERREAAEAERRAARLGRFGCADAGRGAVPEQRITLEPRTDPRPPLMPRY